MLIMNAPFPLAGESEEEIMFINAEALYQC